jgi:hypothetical protein
MPATWIDRIEAYRQLEKYRERPLIVYVTSKREGVGTNMASDALPYIIEQIDMPAHAVPAAHYQTQLADINAAVTSRIDPVDFECKRAVVESSRLAHACLNRGKILACRNPDLMINYNCVTLFRGWEKMTNQLELPAA